VKETRKKVMKIGMYYLSRHLNVPDAKNYPKTKRSVIIVLDKVLYRDQDVLFCILGAENRIQIHKIGKLRMPTKVIPRMSW
jgi:hypothetical protein